MLYHLIGKLQIVIIIDTNAQHVSDTCTERFIHVLRFVEYRGLYRMHIMY
jgi:hypothetical protein